MKKIVSIIIGFVHDLATGCWAATVLAIYWLTRQAIPPESAGIILGLKKQFFYLGIACVLLVLATGAGRTFTYVGNFYGAEAEKTRRKMIIIKHVILLAVFGLGLYWQYIMVYR